MKKRYDIQKLNRMLEQRRAASLANRDIAERYRAAKGLMELRHGEIMRTASKKAIDSGFVKVLLAMPVEQANALKAKDVEEFAVETENGRCVHFSDIPFQTFQSYIEHRERCTLLNAEREAKSLDFQARFAIVPSLVDAVVAWGFKRPDLHY